jgi:hypothetical protein
MWQNQTARLRGSIRERSAFDSRSNEIYADIGIRPIIPASGLCVVRANPLAAGSSPDSVPLHGRSMTSYGTCVIIEGASASAVKCRTQLPSGWRPFAGGNEPSNRCSPMGRPPPSSLSDFGCTDLIAEDTALKKRAQNMCRKAGFM